jgi:hypothetical protein
MYAVSSFLRQIGVIISSIGLLKAVFKEKIQLLECAFKMGRM